MHGKSIREVCSTDIEMLLSSDSHCFRYKDNNLIEDMNISEYYSPIKSLKFSSDSIRSWYH